MIFSYCETELFTNCSRREQIRWPYKWWRC